MEDTAARCYEHADHAAAGVGLRDRRGHLPDGPVTLGAILTGSALAPIALLATTTHTTNQQRHAQPSTRRPDMHPPVS